MPEGAAPASPYAVVVRRLEAALVGPGWELRASAALLALGLLLSTPAWERLSLIVRTTPWRVFHEKAEAPFSQPRAAEASHAGKTTFRLVVPLVAGALDLGPYGVLALQGGLGFAFLALALRLGRRETGDRVSAFLLAASLAFGYVGKSGFVDLFCWFDAWAYFFLLAALAMRGPLAVFLLSSLAAWTDERAFIALGLVAVWHLLPSPGEDPRRVPQEAAAVVAAALGYVVSRAALAAAFSLYTPTEDAGLGMLEQQLPLLGLAWWSSLEGAWIPVVAALWTWRDPETRVTLLAGGLITALLLVVSFGVIDMTRSGAYAFPATFIAVRLLAGRVSRDFLCATLFVAALVSLLFPDHYLQTGWQQPYLLRLLTSYLER